MASALRARVFALTLLTMASSGPIALADAPSCPGKCPAKLTCDQLRAKVAVNRRELKQLEKQLADKQSQDPIPKEVDIEGRITVLCELADCRRCGRKLRSEVDMIRAGIEGLIAQYYDSWGMKKGEDGRRSFRSVREATRVDPENLAAWTAYGKTLVAVANRSFKDRIAKYLGIDLLTEMKSTASNLRRLLAGAGKMDGAQEVLDALTPLIPPTAAQAK